MENVLLCQSLILQDLIDAVIPYEKIKPVEPLPTPPTDPEVSQLKFFKKYFSQIKNKNPNTFKTMSKDWIWKNIPSY